MDNLPAHLLSRTSRALAQSAVSGLGGNMPPHISIARNRFTLVDAAGNKRPVEQLHLDIIVVDVNQAVSKIYYEGDFDPAAEDHKPPTCFSDNGIGASAQATTPQAASCMMCPHNAWGSDTSKITGKATKACNDFKKVAVILSDANDDIVYLLRIPPATLKVWKTYATSIGSRPLPDKSRNFDLSDVITRITFDENVQGVLNFKPLGYINEEHSAWIDSIWAETKTDALVGRTDVVVTADRVAITNQAVAAPKPALAPPPKPQIAPPKQFTPPETTTPAPQRKPGRPRKPDAVAAPAKQPADDDRIPPFLQRQPDAPSKPQFGMETAGDAPDDLADAIDAAFRLPT